MLAYLPARCSRAWSTHPYVRLAVLAAVASTAAWTLGTWLPGVSPLVAAITAIIAVRPTFHDALAEGIRQVVGTLVGAAAAAAVVLTVGFSPLALLVTVIAAYGTARLLRLGDDAAPTIAITVLLVVAVNLDETAVEERFLGVVLGSALGLAVSWWTRPGTPSSRALSAGLRQADLLAALLGRVSAALAQRAEGRPVPLADAVAWLEQAQAVSRDLVAARVEAEAGLTATRWAPARSRSEAERVLAQVQLSEATAATVVSMCRDLMAAALDDERLPPRVTGSLSQVFAAAADAISRQADNARLDPAQPLPRDATAVQDLAEARVGAVATIRRIDDTEPLLLGGSLLADSERITRLLTDGAAPPVLGPDPLQPAPYAPSAADARAGRPPGSLDHPTSPQGRRGQPPTGKR